MLRIPAVALSGLLLGAAGLAAQTSSPAEQAVQWERATIVSVTIMGPYVLTYVHPNDEPWGVFPYGY